MEIHEYGLEMEKYWMVKLKQGETVEKTDIYDIGTQILAELMGQLFSLLVKSCEFLAKVNEDVKEYRSKFTVQNLISMFTEYEPITHHTFNRNYVLVKFLTPKSDPHFLYPIFPCRFRKLLLEEVDAVGETCGGVMIKIPSLSDPDIIEIMEKLYIQISFVDICIAKSLRAVIPMIILYAFHRRVGDDGVVL